MASSIFDEPNPQTAFGELQVAQSEPKVQLQFAYNINDAIIHSSSLGEGIVSQSNGKAILFTNAQTSSFASASSHQTIHYGAGQGIDVRFAGLYTSGVVGSSQCIGLGDDEDGYFFGYSGSYFGVLRRRDSVENWTFQHDWNVDTMDSFGPTNMVLDKTMGNVYRIQFQWLGFGAIKYFIENPSTGNYQLVHHDQYANSHTIPSILNPTLPLSICAKNTTNATNIQTEVTSMVAMVEGKPASLTVRNTASGSGTITTLQNILTLRNKTTFAGKRNRVVIFPDFMSVASDGNKSVRFAVIKDAVLSGSVTFQDVNTNESVVSVSTDATSVSNGDLFLVIDLAKIASDKFFLKDFLTLHPDDQLTIAAESDNSSEVIASVSWVEQF